MVVVVGGLVGCFLVCKVCLWGFMVVVKDSWFLEWGEVFYFRVIFIYLIFCIEMVFLVLGK